MHYLIRLTLPLAVLALASMPLAAQDKLETLQQGRYQCGLPGDAAGPAWVTVPERAFSITGGSSYTSAKGGGTYLLKSDMVTFTRGPMKDMKLKQTGSGLLQQILPNGSLGRLRCHRTGPLR